MKKFLTNRTKFILTAFFIFQLLVLVIFQFASKWIPAKGGFIYQDTGQKPVWLWNRANFDGVHYLMVAKNGYGLYQQAFFPLYPLFILFLARLFNQQYLLSGFLISFFSSLAALFILYKLVLLDYQDKIARKTIFYLLLFPTSFFLSTVYTEAFFLCLTLLAFYWARKGKWLLVPLVTALASATRIVGIFLLPALLFELWCQNTKKRRSKIVSFLLALWLIIISPLGLVLYMNYLKVHFNDPLMFLHVQPNFGAERSSNKVILLYQVFWRYFKMIATCQKNSLLYFIVWLEFLSALLIIGLLVFAYFSKINRSYLIFSFLSFITPTLTGTFLSLPRFFLVLFPCFIILAVFQEKHPFLGKIYSFLSLGLFFVCQFLFSQGYWVS